MTLFLQQGGRSRGRRSGCYHGGHLSRGQLLVRGLARTVGWSSRGWFWGGAEHAVHVTNVAPRIKVQL